MNETTKCDWSLLRKRFGLSLIGSLLFSGFAFFQIFPMWGSEMDRLFLALVVVLWGTGALLAARRYRISDLAAAAFGLSWGPLVWLLFIYIVQGNVRVWYPTMFILIPLLVTLTWVPIAYLARWRFERRHHAV